MGVWYGGCVVWWVRGMVVAWSGGCVVFGVGLELGGLGFRAGWFMLAREKESARE